MNGNISVKNLSVKFLSPRGDVHVLKNISETFKEGLITGLIGESGSGKSVLGMSILQLLPPEAIINGSCIYNGNDLYSLSAEEILGIRQKEIALIPQNPLQSLNPVLRIGRQLTEPLKRHLKMSKVEAREHVSSDLKNLYFDNPEQILRSYSFQLSGGMNQRVVSSMGMSCRPKWIIADEPTKGLDAILRKQVYEVFKEIKHQGTESIILITHDLPLAKKLCDEIMVLYKGAVVERGNTKQVFEKPAHPYTKALIKALPSEGMQSINDPISGKRSEESSCLFYDRCKASFSKCVSCRVENFEIESNHIVRCNLYAESK